MMSGVSLRVAFVSDATHGRNGVGTYYDDLTGHLQGVLERAELIAPDRRRHWHQSVSIPIPGDSSQRLYFPRYGCLPKLLGEIRPHIVVIPTIGPYSVMAMWHAKRLGIRLCLAHHTDFEQLAELYMTHLAAGTCKPFFRWIYTRLLRTGSLVATINARTAMSVRQMGVPDVRVVGTPVSKLFIETPTCAMSGELKSVLYVGRLAPEKKIDKIIQAAAGLPQMNFTIVGDGPLRGLVESEAKRMPNLHYTGWIPREDVVSMIDRVDLLVLPSAVESFGTVALEALCRKRLVLVSEQCGILDWPSLAEHLFSIQSGETLMQAIQRIASFDPAIRQRHAQQGFEAARSTNQAAVNDWLSILTDLGAGPEQISHATIKRAS